MSRASYTLCSFSFSSWLVLNSLAAILFFRTLQFPPAHTCSGLYIRIVPFVPLPIGLIIGLNPVAGSAILRQATMKWMVAYDPM